MDALPLPARASLEQYRKRAKDLVKACESPDPDAVRAWAADWLEALRKQLDQSLTPFVRDSMSRAANEIESRVKASRAKAGKPCTLADAQFLIAQAHGFDRWDDFAKTVAALAQDDSPFERAADAVVSGDLDTLRALVGADPSLIHARSTRMHRVALLHYVAANGVEDFRQRSPKNAPEIARLLLEQGADVNATAATYGGRDPRAWGKDKDQTTMNLLVSSVHPAAAGVQVPLVHTLLDFGAAVNGLDDNGSPLFTALRFGYGPAADALVARGARVDNIVTAAALGRVERVTELMREPTDASSAALRVAPKWLRLTTDSKGISEFAFAWACKFGRTDVARVFIDAGVDAAAKDDDMSALHWAAANGLTEIVSLLLARGAPLEATNRWGGTVLSSTVHFALHIPAKGVDYVAVIETLLGAGADPTVIDVPTGNVKIDEVLRKRTRPFRPTNS